MSSCPLGWFMGVFMPFPQTAPNMAASSIKSDLEKVEVMGQPMLNPLVDRAWLAREEERRKAFL